MRRVLASAAAATIALVGAVVSISNQATAAPTVTTAGLAVDGYLLLDLGSPDRFEYRTTEAPRLASKTQQITQSSTNKCQVSPTSGGLVSLIPTGGDVGLITDGLGTRAKNGGTNCGQITGTQSLSVKLGTDLAGKAISRAEVDVESKFACSLRVTWNYKGVVLATEKYTLSTRADCGPDSGSNDNTRVRISAPSGGADEVVFSAAQGAVSIEGGVESPALTTEDTLGTLLNTKASVFEIVEYDGVLDCEGTGANVYRENDVTLTRVDPDSLECVPIAFALSRVDDEVTFAKDLGTQTFAEFTLDLTWEPEPSTYPGRVTEIDYFDGRGFNDMVFCAGTTLDPLLPGDQIPSTTLEDGWCVASQSTLLVGSDQMQVTEKLYGKSDPRMR